VLVAVVVGLQPRRPFSVSLVALNESTEAGPIRIVVFLEAGVVFCVVGGIPGALEGLLLTYPPAAILGLF
jgi:hypothetical protein